MEVKEITCVECPNGCLIKLEIENGQIKTAQGFICERGRTYAENEYVCPRRVLTTTVKVAQGGVLSVKTDKSVKKDNLFEIMKKVNEIIVNKTIKIGEIVCENIDEDINLIATQNLIIK